jgi:hypothetical protein
MMEAPEKRKPDAATSSFQSGSVKRVRALDNEHFGTAIASLQVAIIANRFRLSLPVARLVCELAAIGGRCG